MTGWLLELVMIGQNVTQSGYLVLSSALLWVIIMITMDKKKFACSSLFIWQSFWDVDNTYATINKIGIM